jgi:hypothetical protein
LAGMQKSEIQKIRLIQGHQYYGIHRVLPTGVSHTYFTMLRHPIAKVISAYQSYQRTFDSSNHEAAMKYSLKEHLAREIKLHFDNGYTRSLAFESKEEDKKVGWGELTEEHFFTARRRLLEMICGTTEQYDESLTMMYLCFDWKKFPFYSRANFAKKKHIITIDQETVDEIRRLNQYDLKLWQEAQRASFDIGNRVVKRFKLLNKLVGPLYTSKRLKRLLRSKLCKIAR